MKKKKWPFFLGLSMLAGLTGSSLIRSKKINSTKKAMNPFTGHWQFDHKFLKMKHQLTIHEDATLILDHQPLEVEQLQRSKHQWIFRDKYGFTLILTYSEPNKLTLYDEAEDFTYQLTKIAQ